VSPSRSPSFLSSDRRRVGRGGSAPLLLIAGLCALLSVLLPAASARGVTAAAAAASTATTGAAEGTTAVCTLPFETKLAGAACPFGASLGTAAAGRGTVTGFAAEGASGDLPTFEVDADRMPNIARNVQSALDEGQPGVLNRTTDQSLISANRAAACQGFCGPGSPDEYPFASTMQGGAGARVAGVPLQEQFVQGGLLRAFYTKYGIGEGDPFQVVVTGLEDGEAGP